MADQRHIQHSSGGSGRPVVEARGVRKAYDDGTEALRGIDLSVQRGEVVGLLGPNGAGKTTMVEILAGFRHRSAGEVHVLGLDPGVAVERDRMLERVGMVPQSSGHLRYLTVRETVDLHRAWHAAPRSADEVLEIAGLADHAGHRVRELSGGQQRRMDVALALVGRPELVFLDEPTTGFDPEARRRAWTLVGGLRELGVTVLLTTHYMEEAQALADRVVVLAGGCVVEEGTPGELARHLGLRTRVRATLPPGAPAGTLPEAVREVLGSGPLLDGDVDDAVPVLAELCAWASAAGVQLDDLEVARPTLEERYLALVGDGAAEAAAAGDGSGRR